ncbi:restriction endonuclease [Streptosporangium sp. NPDC000095]|uniref:restriction endonuclease n=1 Tax=Streptosporangium sp. NPDC000095 TaxID=3366184 RepID=UPI00369AA923
MGDEDHVVPFADLATADLVLDAVYAGGSTGNFSDDPISRLLPGVGNQGGFRFNGSPQRQGVRFAVLFTTGAELDWPDELDPQTGLFTYYGDNRHPGKELHETPRRGNVLLRDAFEWSHGVARASVPPFFLFEKASPAGRRVRFRGLLAPGGAALTSDDELQAIWRSSRGVRFQNYRSRFTVLDVPKISRSWIVDLAAGRALGPGCPAPWKEWVEARTYRPLLAASTTTVRSTAEQKPDVVGRRMVAAIHRHFSNRPHDFEACAVEIWRMLAPATDTCELTPRSRDGGRDAVGEYLLGPASDRVAMEFALEAKCYALDKSVGVKEVARLISRIRHRQFGVFITTSYFNKQVYSEVRADAHPIIMICARDIVDVLRRHGYGDVQAVQEWLDHRFPEPSAV